MGTLSFDTSAILGWLFESTLYISILVCVILVLKAVTKGKLPAWWSYGLWLLLVLRMFVPWSFQSPVNIFNFFPETPDNDAYIPFLMEQVVSLPLAGNTSNVMSWDKPLLLVWFAGILFFSVSSLLKNLMFWVAIKRIVPVEDKTVLDLFDDCRGMLAVRRNVALIVTDRVKSPALFGYLKPRLLIPPSFLNSLGEEDLRCVFFHELGHLKSHDIGISWLVNVLQVIYWFNPIVWYAFHNMRIDQEVACDAYVLSRIKYVNPADYANTIVDILERFVQNRQLPSLAGIIENKSQIKRRIAMILKYRKYSKKITITSIVMLFIAGFIFFTLTGYAKEEQSNMVGREFNRPTTKQWPQVKPGDKADESRIIICIKKEGDIWIEDQKVDIASMVSRMERFNKEYPDGFVLIAGDRDTLLGKTIEVLDKVRMTGIKNVSVAIWKND